MTTTSERLAALLRPTAAPTEGLDAIRAMLVDALTGTPHPVDEHTTLRELVELVIGCATEPTRRAVAGSPIDNPAEAAAAVACLAYHTCGFPAPAMVRHGDRADVFVRGADDVEYLVTCTGREITAPAAPVRFAPERVGWELTNKARGVLGMPLDPTEGSDA